ncbi:serine hydrolase domain-containing protein [Frankia sp. R82]|uniref:serine hydrolase domain-containing protein n=1 Tax=Frankia sp. R82 TaxID=2950553 RepID=UPI002043D2EC|nr:serine hydrolase domain-containing protein [Frankia sp. R82]MCM3882936.1 beta-lactamase family protein [Frankia sp. R82]
MDALEQVTRWPVETAAVCVLRREPDGAGGIGVRELGQVGPADHPFRLASVSKLLAAYAVLIAVEEGAIGLSDPAGPPSSTVAHLLAHASGLEFGGERVFAAPGTRRIYSNTGIERLGDVVTAATGITFADYLAEAVFAPLGMAGARLTGSPAHGVRATLDDLRRFAAELLVPSLLSPAMVATATSVAFPGLSGVLPGFGRQDPNDWGLGFEIRGHKDPHWTGRTNTPATFGHFGQAGSFLWVDPVAGLSCVALSDRDFGEWARDAWPPLSDDIVAAGRPSVVDPAL